MESWEGKIGKSSIDMGLSDFYSLHNHYTTRLILHTRDSKGQPSKAFSAALDLLDGVKVEAIIDPESQLEEKLLGETSSNIPIVSFLHTTTQSTETYPFLVQMITEDETSQVKGIVSVIEAFKRRDVVLIYDHFNDQSEVIVPHLLDFLHKKNIHTAYEKAFLLNSTLDDTIVEVVKKMKDLQSKVFIVHLSPTFLSSLLSNAVKLGMMSKGYFWVMTTTSINGLRFLNSSVIESMQGVIGFKNFKPDPWRLHHFTSRMRKELSMEDRDEKITDHLISSFGIWVYDGIWCLAKAIEREKTEIGSSGSGFGPILIKELLKTELSGLSGGVRFRGDGKMMSMGIKGGEKRVGFLSSKDETKMQRGRISRRRHESSISYDLEANRWSEGSHTKTKSLFMRKKYIKLRIGVPVLVGFKELVNVEYDENNKTKVTGFCIDVFTQAISLLPNYEIDYEFIPFINSSGQMNGTYDDLVHQVHIKNFDAVVGDVTITAARLQDVDFTISFTDIGVGMVAVDDSNNTWFFFKPLSRDLWFTTFCFFIFTGFAVWVIERPINHEFQGSRSQQIGTMLWFAFSTLVYAHREKLVNNLSKFVVIVWLFLVFILSSSYTATLASMMTVKQLQLDPKKSFIGYPVFDSPILGILNNLYYDDFTLKPYSPSFKDYSNALTIGSKHGGVSAIIDEIPYIRIFLTQNLNEKFYLAGTMSTTCGFGFVFPKGSPLVSEMSWAIAKLREEKKIKMLENLWFNDRDSSSLTNTNGMDQNSSPDNNNPVAANPLTLDYFCALFIISGTSSILAMLIFFFFHFHSRYHIIIQEFMVLHSINIMEYVRRAYFPARNLTTSS